MILKAFPFKHDDMDMILNLAIKILERHGCEWWLMAGSCLGAVRNGNYLNYDIDIGVPAKYLTLWGTFIEDFEDVGLKLYMKWTQNGKKISLAFCLMKDGKPAVKLDLFFYYEKGDHWWFGLFGPDKLFRWGEHKVFYPVVFRKEFFINRKEMFFREMKCWVPCPPEEYLKEWYGDSWMIPTFDYVSWRDCKAINKEFLNG